MKLQKNANNTEMKKTNKSNNPSKHDIPSPMSLFLSLLATQIKSDNNQNTPSNNTDSSAKKEPEDDSSVDSDMPSLESGSESD